METNRKEPRQSSGQRPQGRGRRFGSRFLVTFLILFVFWIVFSGKFDRFHLTLGVISCVLVASLTSELLFPSFTLKRVGFLWPRFFIYIPYLLLEVFKANIHVMTLVFHPRMMELINPTMITFRSRLTSEMALTTFANSITLTPGTITVFVTDYGEFHVHCIDTASGRGLPGDMERRIANVFGE